MKYLLMSKVNDKIGSVGLFGTKELALEELKILNTRWGTCFGMEGKPGTMTHKIQVDVLPYRSIIEYDHKTTGESMRCVAIEDPTE